MPAPEILAALERHGRTLAIAESFTGGQLVDRFIAVPGSSKVVVGSLVAYHNDLKRRLLGVREGTLLTVGAVSDGVAREMADGVRRLFAADIGVATTGIAGPDGGTPTKPVGTSFAAAVGPSIGHADRRLLAGDREEIRRRGADHALDVLAALLAREGIL